MHLNKFAYKSQFPVITALLLIIFAIPTRTADQTQDQTFRLLNIERRLDQLQVKVDYLERMQQTQSLNTTTTDRSQLAVQELQRQQLSLAEQVVTMQKQMLILKKEIDRLAGSGTPDNKEENKERPKATAKKP